MPTLMKLLALPLMLLMLSGCGTRPTELRGVKFWEGLPNCLECESRAIDMMAFQGDQITLRRNSTYTLQARLRPGTALDSCMRPMLSGSWQFEFNIRNWECVETKPIMTHNFRTHGEAFYYAPPDILSISIREALSGERHELPPLFVRRLAVVWETSR